MGMLLRSNSAIPGFVCQAEPLTDKYKRMAEITMQAVEDMPAEWQELVQEFGYIDVYRAWRKRWSPEDVRAKAARNGGFFQL